MTTKLKIAEYWYDQKISHNWFSDINEPCCWACGDFFNHNRSVANDSEREKAWEKSPLQKCHITPKSLGGSDKPENLVLMCAHCHDKAPDTTNPEILFGWMKKQSFLNTITNECNEATLSLIEDWQNARFYELMSTLQHNRDCVEYVIKNTSQHAPQTTRSRPAVKMISTLGAFKTYIDETYITSFTANSRYVAFCELDGLNEWEHLKECSDVKSKAAYLMRSLLQGQDDAVIVSNEYAQRRLVELVEWNLNRWRVAKDTYKIETFELDGIFALSCQSDSALILAAMRVKEEK